MGVFLVPSKILSGVGAINFLQGKGSKIVTEPFMIFGM